MFLSLFSQHDKKGLIIAYLSYLTYCKKIMVEHFNHHITFHSFLLCRLIDAQCSYVIELVSHLLGVFVRAVLIYSYSISLSLIKFAVIL